MLLAAGLGKRMLPLTATTPKPLLEVNGQSLIERHLQRLANDGFKNIVINHSHLGEQITAKLGNGQQYGLSISYSDESKSGPLETAGGILKALPLIHSDPFIVINGDIFTDFSFGTLLAPLKAHGRLVMVANPPQHPKGDFSVDQQNRLISKDDLAAGLTFSGIALYHKSLFKRLRPGKLPLAPIFRAAISEQRLEALVYTGEWHDIGTPQRLAEINSTIE